MYVLGHLVLGNLVDQTNLVDTEEHTKESNHTLADSAIKDSLEGNKN